MQQNQEVEVFEYFLKPGYIVANSQDSVVRAVLGNCVAVALFDRKRRFGGMNHFVLPSTRDRRRATPQFGNIAIPALCRMVFDLGAEKDALEAQIVGGACSDEVDDKALGKQNVAIARKLLKRYGIPVVSEDVGGRLGRKIVYHTGTNETVVLKVEKIRDSDWFLPHADLRFG